MENVLVRDGRVERCDASGSGIPAAGDGAFSMWGRRRFIVSGCVCTSVLK